MAPKGIPIVLMQRRPFSSIWTLQRFVSCVKIAEAEIRFKNPALETYFFCFTTPFSLMYISKKSQITVETPRRASPETIYGKKLEETFAQHFVKLEW